MAWDMDHSSVHPKFFLHTPSLHNLLIETKACRLKNRNLTKEESTLESNTRSSKKIQSKGSTIHSLQSKISNGKYKHIHWKEQTNCDYLSQLRGKNHMHTHHTRTQTHTNNAHTHTHTQMPTQCAQTRTQCSQTTMFTHGNTHQQYLSWFCHHRANRTSKWPPKHQTTTSDQVT